MRTGLTKQEKTTDIWFDEKDPLIHIRTHNTDLKKRLACLQPASYPATSASQTDADPETGCMEFDIRKGAFLFPSDRPIQRGTTGSNAAICQRKQHYKLVEIMWICSYSCAILFSKAQNGRYKFVGEKI